MKENNKVKITLTTSKITKEKFKPILPTKPESRREIKPSLEVPKTKKK